MNQQSQFPSQPITIKINPADTSAVICPCGSEVFSEGVMLRKISGILTGSGKTTIKGFPVMYCVKCGKAVPEFVPEEFKPIVAC